MGGPCSPNALAHLGLTEKYHQLHEAVSNADIMTVPYQCIVARSSESSDDWTVFAASGSKIVVQSSRGSVTTWPQQDAQIEVSDGVLGVIC